MEIQAVWAGEESSGKLIGFLTCQSNPGPPLRGSWLLAFSLQFVIKVTLHFDLIRPIGMAPNKNQSSGWNKRGSGQRRTSWLAGISTGKTNSLYSLLSLFPSLFLLLPPTPPTCSAIVPVHIGHKIDSFHLTKNQRLCLPTWLLEAHGGRHFTLIKYGLLANWMNANVFKPLNHMLPGDIRACRAILLCVPFLITV